MEDANNFSGDAEMLIKRYLAAGDYVLFYQPAVSGIMIVRVLYGSRDIPAIFRN